MALYRAPLRPRLLVRTREIKGAMFASAARGRAQAACRTGLSPTPGSLTDAATVLVPVIAFSIELSLQASVRDTLACCQIESGGDWRPGTSVHPRAEELSLWGSVSARGTGSPAEASRPWYHAGQRDDDVPDETTEAGGRCACW